MVGKDDWSYYLQCANDWMLKLSLKLQTTKSICFVSERVAKHVYEIDLNDINPQNMNNQWRKQKHRNQKTKIKSLEKIETEWENKPFHEKYPQKANNNNDIDITATRNWLSTAGLKSETEGFL